MRTREEASEISSEKGQAKNSSAETTDARGILTTTKKRVTEILEATEMAAAKIMETATEESEKLVRETHQRAERLAAERMARISDLTESVMAKADTIDRELEDLRKVINESVAVVAEELEIVDRPKPEPPAAKAQPASSANPAANGKHMKPTGSGSAEQASAISDADRADALQLLATQLLISGETVESASKRMAEEFGVENPRFVLESLDFKPIRR